MSPGDAADAKDKLAINLALDLRSLGEISLLWCNLGDKSLTRYLNVTSRWDV
jgi:hypothetical protein